MAKVKTLSRPFARRLEAALRSGLRHAGIEADVRTTRVPTTRLTRVLVTARKFSKLKPSERQDLVWRIVSQGFTPEEQLLISMILTMTPDELAGR